MQKIKRILVLLMCLALFPIVGCQQKEVVQYDGDVMAVVNRETESFVIPIRALVFTVLRMSYWFCSSYYGSAVTAHSS